MVIHSFPQHIPLSRYSVEPLFPRLPAMPDFDPEAFRELLWDAIPTLLFCVLILL